MKRHTLSCLLILYCITLTAQDTKKLDKVMQTYHGYNMFDGAVLVAEQGKVIYKKGFGLANREWNIPNTPQTKFMIGSVSKQLTAMLILSQVQKGLIDLDKTITDYIPSFSAKNGRKITIRQLLSHSSGMPNYEIIPDFFPRISRQYFTREDYIKLYMDSALLFEPGTGYSYSSWGYYTLGYIAEKVSGKSYSALMKEDIFDKIGMNSSGSYAHTQIVPNRATGYDYSLGGYTSNDFRDQSNTMGTGDLYSTVEDLFKLHLSITNHTLLNEQHTREMFTPGIRPWQYGYGWFNQNFRITPSDSVFTNYHLGMTDGFISFFLRVPSTNSMIVILCNSSPTDFFGITRSLLQVLYNKNIPIKQPLHKMMERTISKSGTAAAVAQYESLKKDTAHYNADWWNIDQLGHQLYNLKRYEEALLIFKNNAADFPQRDIALNSLAQTFEILGRKEEAIATYKKAILINKQNEEAKGKLKLLEKQ